MPSRRQSRPGCRRGVAAVEFALVAPLLVGILVGLWEVGRLIQLRQILSNATRDGARVASYSQIINSTGAPTQIQVSTGDPNVKQTVVNYLQRAGLNVTSSDVDVQFAFLTGDTTKTQPYQGAKGQQFQVTVTIPLASLKWTNLGIFQPVSLTTSVVWTCLVDDPFTLNTTLPSW